MVLHRKSGNQEVREKADCASQIISPVNSKTITPVFGLSLFTLPVVAQSAGTGVGQPVDAGRRRGIFDQLRGAKAMAATPD